MRLSLIKSAIIGLLALVLMGCNAVRLTYNNAPQLAWWWLDGYVDFSREQAPQVQRGIDRWFEWHRATQLPEYAALLASVGREVLEPATPAQACRWQGRMRDALDPSLDRAIELAADLVPGLTEVQFRHLEQRFAKINDELRDDYLQPDLAERARESVKRTVERVERLYGTLNEAQKRLVAAGVHLPGLHAGDVGRTALEAYPGLLAHELIGRRPYKNDTSAERLLARKDLLEALEQGRTRLGLRLKLTPAQAGELVADASGDRDRRPRGRDAREARRPRVCARPLLVRAPVCVGCVHHVHHS